MKLFGRARKILQGFEPEKPPAPQYYRVACAAGHTLRGPRTDGYQAIRCPGCGEGLFVLPRSPLPDPPAPRSKPRPAAENPAASTPEPEIQYVEVAPDFVEFQDSPSAAPAKPLPSFDPTPDPPTADPAQPAPSRPRQQRRPARSQPAPPARVSAPRPDPRTIALPPRKAWHRRHRPTLIVMLVAALAAATVGWRIWKQRLELLPGIAAEAREAGLQALAAGEFDLAKDRLATAANALARLGDPQQTEAQQLAREAAIFADLATASLEEIIEQVATKPGGWDELRLVHRGRSILVDAHVLTTDSIEGVRLDYRLFAGSRAGLIDLADFELFQSQTPNPGDPVTFGARIERVELGADNLWHVYLIPDSGVLLTTPEAWKATESLGWLPSPAEPEAPR